LLNPRARVGPTPIERARTFLAKRFAGDRDAPLLLCGYNQVQVHFDPLADRAAVLWLEGIHVGRPGTGLGGRIIEALREHADHTGLLLLIGPAVNHTYWAADYSPTDDRCYPRRHPWLTMVGLKDAAFVYAYAPGSTPLPAVYDGHIVYHSAASPGA